MSQQIVAVLTVKKETTNKVVFTETDSSPAGGALESVYIPKFLVKTMLGGATTITMLIEAGDQSAAAA